MYFYTYKIIEYDERDIEEIKVAIDSKNEETNEEEEDNLFFYYTYGLSFIEKSITVHSSSSMRLVRINWFEAEKLRAV